LKTTIVYFMAYVLFCWQGYELSADFIFEIMD